MAQEKDSNDKPKPVVLLAAGGNITTLALARCFRNTGIPVIALDTDGAGRLLRSTRLIDEVHPLGCPALDPGACLRRLRLLGEQLTKGCGGRTLLFPTEDSGLRFCADHYRQIIEHFVLPGDPAENEISRLTDKGLFFSLFKGNEPYVPLTRAFADREQVQSQGSEISYPVVVKPSRKGLGLSFQNVFGAKLVIARSFDALRGIVDSYYPPAGIVLQELIEHSQGDEVSWWGYRSQAARIVGMTARQLRKHPRMGGTATLVRSEGIQELHGLAQEILEKADFRGLCELEFLPGGGGYKLIECNPRPWLQIGLALRAGLNLPLLAHREAEGSLRPEDASLWTTRAQENLYWMSPEYDLIRCFFSGGRRSLPKNLWTWCRDVRRADEKGIWDMKEPRVVLERLLSYPGKARRNRSLLRRGVQS